MNKNGAIFDALWLKSVSDDTLQQLARRAHHVTYQQGERLYAIGGPQEWLWGIEKGQVQVRVALNEAEPILGHMYNSGSWFGESEPIQGADGFIEAKATMPTRVVRVPFVLFSALANERPELWRALVLLTSQTQLLAMSAGHDLLSPSPRKRIAATILRLSGARHNFQRTGETAEIRVSQDDIANLANISRSKASRHLQDLQQAGLIDLKYGRIAILDPVGLSGAVQ